MTRPAHSDPRLQLPIVTSHGDIGAALPGGDHAREHLERARHGVGPSPDRWFCPASDDDDVLRHGSSSSLSLALSFRTALRPGRTFNSKGSI